MVDEKEIKERLGNTRNNIVDPEIEKVRMMSALTDPKGNEVLSDLSDNVIVCMALFRALDYHLKMPNEVVGLPSINVFFNEYIKLRSSRERLGRKELVDCVKAGNRVYNYGNANVEGDNVQKPGLLSRLAFWRK
jgi:hypothetical protein